MLKTFSSLNGSVRRRRSGRRASDKSEKVAVPAANTKLIDSEDAATGSVGLGVYVRYFKSIGVFLGVSAVLCNAFNQAAAVYSSSNYNLSLISINI